MRDPEWTCWGDPCFQNNTIKARDGYFDQKRIFQVPNCKVYNVSVTSITVDSVRSGACLSRFSGDPFYCG
jgi:hypothetical protein